ncbi:coiled-coil-helix-coiled-coil-helix domain-containing protein 5 isoform X2 [Rhineura floridana]|uniref:coiled-coil-helix-coiled-coil-helix domain-containing protein 5 isoform X2 n=1 Tax=Rhineura floridana TaxID=261503 RepID=UPI002AC87D77|nr:coiled-coil-helix-coiled-coil-helix domain-containing protein 5 isoform X2 [Rhineura floridana]
MLTARTVELRDFRRSDGILRMRRSTWHKVLWCHGCWRGIPHMSLSHVPLARRTHAWPGEERQAVLEVTARHCRKEAEQYGQCVTANPSTWQQDCHQLKLDMAKCTSSQRQNVIFS